MISRNFLAYGDTLFTPSESFIVRGYRGFDALTPVYAGHDVRGPGPAGADVLALGALHGVTGEAGFKQFGILSARLKDEIARRKPVLIHASFGKSGTYALPIARQLGLPLVVTYYGGDATKHSNTRDSLLRVYNRRRAALWREAALILPCSDFLWRELAAKGCPEDKMIVHHNTADAEQFQPGEKQKIILFAGRWTHKKGIDTLIAALARLGPALDGWRVRLLGDGELKAPLIAELAAAGIVAELPGWIPADEMPRHFAEAMIVCVPSKRAPSGDAEGMPLVCIEAMLSGCALAATRHAGIPECVRDGETGYLVEENDTDALADRLSRMISDKDATREMGRKGRALALSDFNLARQSRKLQDHLLGVARAAGTLAKNDR
ncbi:MAG: glycosyltransferase [Hyphomonas sp.]|uniref:glycosyltransferase n=1 Tax=Hyphomonas sp. TaxID=87 RepID=UPI0034A024A8